MTRCVSVCLCVCVVVVVVVRALPCSCDDWLPSPLVAVLRDKSGWWDSFSFHQLCSFAAHLYLPGAIALQAHARVCKCSYINTHRNTNKPPIGRL